LRETARSPRVDEMRLSEAGETSASGNFVSRGRNPGSRACGPQRCASAAQIFVRQIEQALVVRIGVDRGHRSAVDAEGILQNFCYGSQTVCGAGSVGDDVVFCRIVSIVVHTEHKRGVGSIGGRGNDYFLHGRPQVLLGLGTLGEQARRFHDNVRPDGCPIDFRWVLSLENLEAFALDRDGVFGVRYLVRKIAQDRIVLQQMRQRFRIGDVVDGDKLNVPIVQSRAHDVAPDAAKTVNTYLNGHSSSEWDVVICGSARTEFGHAAKLKIVGATTIKVNEPKKIAATKRKFI